MSPVPVVDTEFLFALRGSDRKHSKAKEILERIGERRGRASLQLLIPPIVATELVLVLLSEGKSAEVVRKTLDLVRDISERYGIGFALFSLDQLKTGLSVYETSGIGLFDSLIAGVASELNTEIVGDDPDFDIPGVKHLTFLQYLSNLKKAQD